MVYFAPQAKIFGASRGTKWYILRRRRIFLEHTELQSGIFCAAGENFRDKEIPNLMNSWVPKF